MGPAELDGSLGPAFFRSPTCTLYLARTPIRPVPPVPCKRKVEPCKYLSVQKICLDSCKRGLSEQVWDLKKQVPNLHTCPFKYSSSSAGPV